MTAVTVPVGWNHGHGLRKNAGNLNNKLRLEKVTTVSGIMMVSESLAGKNNGDSKMVTTVAMLAEWPQDIVVTTKMVKVYGCHASGWNAHRDWHRKNGGNNCGNARMATGKREIQW
ncbi:MAG: hypothetical protein P4L87_10790 [Formivibrio sp.]|nr:hypothetical protein [Formivibrio sp.]